MIETLLTSKCLIPKLSPQIVQRSRLHARLEQSLDVPLTLISAPPGFGKTTAVLTALHAFRSQRDVALAWLSLDEADNDVGRFWHYLVASLQMVMPGLGERLPALVIPRSPPTAELLNEIGALPETLVLVLDDYHAIHQSEIHSLLAALLDHMPSNLHLVLVTRADPPLPLGRLRARGQLIEIRAADLRFTGDEAVALFIDLMALPLVDSDIASLTEKTEGWVAGLRLAGLALQGSAIPRHSFIERLSTSNRYILDYLAEEVLAQQPAHIRAFLLQTSILDRMCGSLCDAVTLGSDGQAMLEVLERRNLFLTPLGGAGDPSWFRYHGLFAELLRGQLTLHEPNMVPVLRQRASAWYEAQGEVESAVEQALEAGDFERVVHLLKGNATQLIMEGRILTVERWWQRLPEDWQHRLPQVDMAFAWALIMRGRYDPAVRHLESAKAGLGTDHTTLIGELYALQAALADAQGRASDALRLGNLALTYATDSNLFLRAVTHMALAGALRVIGDLDAAIAAYGTAIPLCDAAALPLPALVSRAQLAYLLSIQGRLRQAEIVTRPVVAQATQHPAASGVFGALADVEMEWNRLSEAEQHVQLALSLAQHTGHNAALARCKILLAHLRRAQGENALAQAVLDDAAILVNHGVPGWVEITLVAEQVMLWLDQGLVGPAQNLLLQRGIHTGDTMSYMREVLPLAQAWTHYHQRQITEARALLDEIIAAADEGGRQRRVIEGLVLRALCQDAAGNSLAVQDDIRQALAMAEPEGYCRIFVDAGSPMAALLMKSTSPYGQLLIEAFPTSVLQAIRTASAAPEPLTEREIEVLRLLANGLTYQEMADHLVLSINTVRHHVKGIYSKLQADTRTLALEKARALNLL